MDINWDGFGAPPVGTVCEACVSGTGNWFKSLVLIHHPDEDGVVGIHDTVGNALLWTDTFRPIKTKEQIAAEERENAAQDMAFLMTGHRNREKDCYKVLGEILYDAGYRKQEND